MNKSIENWKKINKNGKAPLAWNIDDYKAWGEEPPECVFDGFTEGQLMELDDIESWYLDSIRTLSVILDEYPDKFEEQYALYILDLEYLKNLGKINNEQKEKMLDKEINFGQNK